MTHQEFRQRYIYNVITDKLGEGGFGSVFKAYDMHRDRWIALKISKVNPQCGNIRLCYEVELVAKLPTHPNIAYYEACYTFCAFDGEYDFGILQCYEEGNLLQLLHKDAINRVPTEQKPAILTQILEGLEFLHKQGIIHRDLKPQNILIARRGNEVIPKISDFGISKQLDINKSAVFDNSIMGVGTLVYASPEQLGDREIRKNTDLWSFGVIAFQVFSGYLPFTTGEYTPTSEAGRIELFRQINSGKLPKEIDTLPDVWQTLIRRCLVINAGERIKNTQEAKAILAGYGQDVASNVSTETDDKTPIDVPSITRGQIDGNLARNASALSVPVRKYVLVAASVAAIVLLLISGLQAINHKIIHNINNNNPSIAAVETVIDIPMVYVEGGTFIMGCTAEQGNDCFDKEIPSHQVTVSSFHIGKYEVTQAQWQAIMDHNPSWFKGDNLPVENVSWHDVQKFIRELNAQTGKRYRLPTEAEWEFAARGGNNSEGYKYSGSNTVEDVAWYSTNSDSRTHVVGTKLPNELGLYDMSGNVYEWCSDWYGAYSSNAQTNPQGLTSGSDRVYRGGGWYCIERSVRVSCRSNDMSDYRDSNRGFRLAYDSI